MGGASSESQKKGKSVKTKKVKTEAKKEISEEALVVMPGMGGASPVYPGWPHPTVFECEELHRFLQPPRHQRHCPSQSQITY
eukprot:554754-Rhodomonas_salina.1